MDVAEALLTIPLVHNTSRMTADSLNILIDVYGILNNFQNILLSTSLSSFSNISSR